MNTLKIVSRETGDVAATFDLGSLSDSERNRLEMGLLYKVDFERYVKVYED